MYEPDSFLQLQKKNSTRSMNTPARRRPGTANNSDDDNNNEYGYDSDSDDDFVRANALLGLGPIATSAEDRSLQAEVSAYLLEPLGQLLFDTGRSVIPIFNFHIS